MHKDYSIGGCVPFLDCKYSSAFLFSNQFIVYLKYIQMSHLSHRIQKFVLNKNHLSFGCRSGRLRPYLFDRAMCSQYNIINI